MYNTLLFTLLPMCLCHFNFIALQVVSLVLKFYLHTIMIIIFCMPCVNSEIHLVLLHEIIKFHRSHRTYEVFIPSLKSFTVYGHMHVCMYVCTYVCMYHIASNYGPGVYFFPATFHPGH